MGILCEFWRKSCINQYFFVPLRRQLYRCMKYLISGGGTGGHIFPAVSIANALCEKDPEADILFVGASSRMEMERVPQAGYKIIGLPVRGFYRTQLWKNIGVIKDLIISIHQVRRVIRDFKPDVAVGVGGYASGAAMWVASQMGIPVLLQEQNGFAGVTNKLMRNRAQKICVAYPGMEKFFPKEKIILTGNPIRQSLLVEQKDKAQTGRKNLLIIGGSLGARTINNTITNHLTELMHSDIDIVWQTGKLYYENCLEALNQAMVDSGKLESNITCSAFVTDMAKAYHDADLVISRAGASSISEICLLGKASILVPSPNVAEDHQTHNAMALVHKDAAILVRDADCEEQLVAKTLEVIHNDDLVRSLGENAKQLGFPDAANMIADEVMRLGKVAVR